MSPVFARELLHARLLSNRAKQFLHAARPMLGFTLTLIAATLADHVVASSQSTALVAAPGDSAAIPGWDLQSSTNVSGATLQQLSQAQYDSSKWYHIGSKGTVMAGLIQANVYDADELFYSMNFDDVDSKQFAVPWLYRNQFSVAGPNAGQHYFLQTNGISSRADIWLNGQQVADRNVQVGAYGGKSYEITKMVTGSNALVIQAYPSDPLVDLVIGWVDWNPLPPDNGTGVWRDVRVKQTGPVALGVPRIMTDFKGNAAPGAITTVVTLKTSVSNLESTQQVVTLNATVTTPDGTKLPASQTVTLKPGAQQDVTMTVTVKNAQIWWPKQWGDQPLYSATVTATVGTAVSDTSGPQSFGIRYITHEVNNMNDTIFSVNGHTFNVVGAGYASDIFLRWDEVKFISQMKYMLDMGMNTVRLEGKLEHTEMYDITDRMGLLVMPGWECCDKWEGWDYNTDMPDLPLWTDEDYSTANASVRHEIAMMQSHPSVMSFIVGSDWWPNDRATSLYVQAFKDWDWQTPVFAVADKRGYPEELGPSGMKMDGPYDWVPPNYWYSDGGDADKLGVAFGFASEIGPGVGTPEIGSLRKFLSDNDTDALWTAPNDGLYHMSISVSEFWTRTIYDDALFARYGKPTSLDDYLLKAQISDYEASRAMFEGYVAKWNAQRPATGAIYWMMNNAWPSLHWNLFDYYLHPAGSYYGAKTAVRMEHVVYDYQERTVYLINKSLTGNGTRTIETDMMDVNGKVLGTSTTTTKTDPNTSRKILNQINGTNAIADVAFLRLILRDSKQNILSRNVYWVSKGLDMLNFTNTDWWYDTPTDKYIDLSPLMRMPTAPITLNITQSSSGYSLSLTNTASHPAFFIRMNLVDETGEDVTPVFWTDNYITLYPQESMAIGLTFNTTLVKGAMVQMSGANIAAANVTLPAFEGSTDGAVATGPTTTATTSSKGAAATVFRGVGVGRIVGLGLGVAALL